MLQDLLRELFHFNIILLLEKLRMFLILTPYYDFKWIWELK
jgi:hypothetical protein